MCKCDEKDSIKIRDVDSELIEKYCFDKLCDTVYNTCTQCMYMYNVFIFFKI